MDIAGLVKGASKGKGLGNAFLHHISTVQVIFHVVRRFDNESIVHVEGSVDVLRDIRIITDELIQKVRPRSVAWIDVSECHKRRRVGGW